MIRSNLSVTQLIGNFSREVITQWSRTFSNYKMWVVLAGTALSMVPIIIFIVPYLHFIENRKGFALNDAVLNLLPVAELSKLIFFILYVTAMLVVFFCLKRPILLLQGIQMFIVLQYLRNICLFLTPLEAPVDIVPLQDPILEYFAYSNQPYLKDLFFSGHTASMVVFAILCWSNTFLRRLILILTVVMAYLLLVQHCHYTIDIFGGVVAALGVSRLVRFFWHKVDHSL
ncbi:MAG: phosphatase PAP2 family protein [Saprospiraceae bacterium]|nr:phosphatase PAP2 family protein [Saprospiraceae bacterium]